MTGAASPIVMDCSLLLSINCTKKEIQIGIHVFIFCSAHDVEYMGGITQNNPKCFETCTKIIKISRDFLDLWAKTVSGNPAKLKNQFSRDVKINSYSYHIATSLIVMSSSWAMIRNSLVDGFLFVRYTSQSFFS